MTEKNPKLKLKSKSKSQSYCVGSTIIFLPHSIFDLKKNWVSFPICPRIFVGQARTRVNADKMSSIEKKGNQFTVQKVLNREYNLEWIGCMNRIHLIEKRDGGMGDSKE